MLGPNCWTLLILSILTVSVTSDEDDAYCKNGVVSKDDVSQILLLMNNERSNLASGLRRNIQTRNNLPPAKNMRKMAYDCTLEREAKNYLTGLCTLELSKELRPDQGHFFYGVDYISEQPLPSFLSSYVHVLIMSHTAFESVGENGVPKYTDTYDYFGSLLYYENLVRGSASKIGCAERICTTEEGEEIKMSLCLTDQRNIQNGEEIYDLREGEACECDEPWTCNGDSLCISPAKFPESTDEPNTKCSSNEISDVMRMHMQDTHNYRRSLLALGQVVNNQKKTLPAASNMNYLNWDCALEREAHDFLRDCPTDGYLRPDDNSVAQNFYYGTTNEPTFRDMNKKAVTEWWKQVRKVEGPNVANPVFLRKHNSSDIKSYTLMGWASSKEMGCSIAKCGDYWVEACRYHPPGNEVKKQMYKPGKACSKCEYSGEPCDSSLGLCGSKN